MKRETAERITKAIPSMFKNVLAYTKDNVDKKLSKSQSATRCKTQKV